MEAILKDGPNWNVPNLKWEFETFAIAKKGNGGTVLGGVYWGFTVDGNLKITNLPAHGLSTTLNLQDLKAAIEKWNDQADDPKKTIRNHDDQEKFGEFYYPTHKDVMAGTIMGP